MAKTEPRLRTSHFSFKSILILFFALILFIFNQGVGVAIAVLIEGNPLGLSATDMFENARGVSVLAGWMGTVINLAVFLVLALLWRKRGEPYIFKRIPQGRAFVVIPILAIGGVGVTSLYMLLVTVLARHSDFWSYHYRFYTEMMKRAVGPGEAGIDLAQILLLAVAVPIVEELLFRGIILGELKLFLNRYVAVVLSAAIFGLAHLLLVQGIYAFILGLIIGIVYLWTESIFAAMLTHMIFNFYGGVLPQILQIQDMEYFRSPQSTAYLLISLFFFLAMLPVTIWLYRAAREGKTLARYSPAWWEKQPLMQPLPGDPRARVLSPKMTAESRVAVEEVAEKVKQQEPQAGEAVPVPARPERLPAEEKQVVEAPVVLPVTELVEEDPLSPPIPGEAGAVLPGSGDEAGAPAPSPSTEK